MNVSTPIAAAARRALAPTVPSLPICRNASRVISLCLLALLTGCAALPPGKRDPSDRFESFNRSVFRFNQTLDKDVARPVALAYTKVTPAPVRAGVSDFLENLGCPVTVVNDLLQAKPRRFGHDASRFVINTTIGIGGLFDPATKLGLEANNEDFGQTLGYWGVPPGPFLMLPVLGPSDVRDSLGKIVDLFSDPKTYISNQSVSLGLTGVNLVSKRAGLLNADAALNRAFDAYSFLRNAYRARRQFLIFDGNPPEAPSTGAESDDSDDSQPPAT